MGSRRPGHVVLAALLVTLCMPSLIGSAGVPSAASATAPDVDAFLRERLAATDTPGAAWAVVTADAVEHVGTWGRDGDGAPVTEDTPFLWGSVAKPVTATAVMTLVEAGEIDLDAPVRAYLPDFTLADANHAAQVTVRHLLDQTSGIPEFAGDITDRFEDRADPYGEAVADLAEVTPLAAPGESFEYASANYLVLGAVVEAVSGRPYAEYLRDHVLDPLDMDGAITTPDQARRVPEGHGYMFGQPVGLAPRYDQTGASYGYLGGTVTDLAHFAMAHLNKGRYGSTRVLDAASVELMQHGTAQVTDLQRYGLGWRDDTRTAGPGTRSVWHGGASPGYQAMIVLLPEQDLGIVVVQNIYGIFQDGQLAGTGLQAARLLAGGEPGEVDGDPTYPVLLAVLVVVLAAVAGVIGWSVYRMVRPTTTSPRRRRIVIGMVCWMLGGLGLAYLAGILVPGTLGVRLSLIRLWVPDVGWLLTAIAVAGLTLAATCLATGYLRLRRTSALPGVSHTRAVAEPHT
jgi:CubicO group peptidase (beta-lactamase class C family)